MNVLRFLADEDVSHHLIAALLGIEPSMDINAVGQTGAPPKGTLDPDVLLAAEALGRTLISRDKKTMKQHLQDHFDAGHHTNGVILLRSGCSISQYASEIRLIWAVTTADE